MSNGERAHVQAAFPFTIEEIMTDDDDGNLANGTPNCEEICEAAALHGLGCGESCSPPETDPNASEYIIAFESPAITYSSPHAGSDPRNGVDPFGIAVNDINNDGHKDVVLACEGSDNILVYLAQSTQQEGGPYLFQAPTAYPVGDAPDDQVDVAVAGDMDNRICILPNFRLDIPGVGERLFGDRLLYAIDPNPNALPGPRQVRVVDLNSDGLPDLISANGGSIGMDDDWEGMAVLLSDPQ